MRVMRLLSFCLVVTFFAWAQTEKTIETGQVIGEVIDRTAGTPIAGAEVILERLGAGPFPETRADENGHFEFESVAPGHYFLQAIRGGAVGSRRSASAMSRTVPVDVRAGLSSQVIRIYLNTPVSVSGKVMGPQDSAAANVQVTLYSLSFSQGVAHLVPRDHTVSDEKGIYSFDVIEPGEYLLFAQPNNLYDRDALIAGFYPGSVSIENALPITVTESASLQYANIKLRKSQGFSIEGVIDPWPDHEDKLELYLQAAGPDLTGSPPVALHSVYRSRPHFSLRGVVRGDYVIQVKSSDQFGVTLSAQPVSVSSAAVSGLSLRAGDGFTLHGKFRTDVRSIPPGAAKDISQVNVHLSPLDGIDEERVAALHDGEFLFRKLSLGRWLIQVTGIPSGLFVACVSVSGRSCSGPLLTLSTNQSDNPDIILTLADSCAKVVGHVTNDRRPISAVVLLVPESPQLGPMIRAKSASDGSFSFDHLAPGRYELYSWEAPNRARVEDIAYQQQYRTSAVTIDLKPGEVAQKDLAVVPK